MDTWTWIALLVVALLLGAAVAWFLKDRMGRRRLRQRFGPEYDRTVEEAGDRREAELELKRREERIEHLEIRRLPMEERGRFARDWEDVQARFVDDPTGAIADADGLVAEVMRARGYPVGDFEQRAGDISVDHPHVVEHYRAARAIAVRSERGQAGTEELRQAMQHYRALFEDLLEAKGERTAEVTR